MKIFTFLVSSLVGFFITALVFFWFAAGEIYDYEDTFDFESDAAHTDVVVVLAGGKGRIRTAVDLWKDIRATKKKKPEPVLFLSGVGLNTNLETLREQGVPKETLLLFTIDNIVIENVSENTFENAALFASFARQKHWKNIVLVTAGYHMKRAEYILKRALEDDYDIRTKTVDSIHFGRNEWHKDVNGIRVTILEYIKWLYYLQSY